MYEFKRSLTALLGMLTLVTIATIAFPNKGRGANSPNSGAPTTQTQNVNVVNTPTVTAQQSGAWNVGINGTPSVSVVSFPSAATVGIDGSANTVKIDTSKPLPGRDVDNPARQPYQHEFYNFFIPNGSYGARQDFDVPAGKRLVIEEVSLQGGLPTGDVPWLSIATSLQGANGPEYSQLNLPFTKSYSIPNSDSFLATVPIIAYADGGTTASITIGNPSGKGSAGVFNVTLVGHFIDLP